MSEAIANGMTLEQRLEAVEREVADLKLQASRTQASGNWLDKVIGSVTDDEAFREILEYGRQYRQADRPADRDGVEP